MLYYRSERNQVALACRTAKHDFVPELFSPDQPQILFNTLHNSQSGDSPSWSHTCFQASKGSLTLMTHRSG